MAGASVDARHAPPSSEGCAMMAWPIGPSTVKTGQADTRAKDDGVARVNGPPRRACFLPADMA